MSTTPTPPKKKLRDTSGSRKVNRSLDALQLLGTHENLTAREVSDKLGCTFKEAQKTMINGQVYKYLRVCQQGRPSAGSTTGRKEYAYEITEVGRDRLKAARKE